MNPGPGRFLMPRVATVALGILAASFAIACVRTASIPANATRARAVLLDTLGREVGTVTLTEVPNVPGVTVAIEIAHGASPGQHGIHFHTVGSCVGTGAFTSAGAHFNPSNKLHGLLNPAGPHAGDLEAVTVDYVGEATFVATTTRVRLTPGANSLLDTDGSAVVLHARPDDQRTDPSGDTGARIACGVLNKI